MLVPAVFSRSVARRIHSSTVGDVRIAVLGGIKQVDRMVGRRIVRAEAGAIKRCTGARAPGDYT